MPLDGRLACNEIEKPETLNAQKRIVKAAL
jgi:hypothetical protein